jgi:hypothetical protein
VPRLTNWAHVRPAESQFRQGPQRPTGRVMLHDFAAIAWIKDSERVAAIADFAARWGVLEICTHDRLCCRCKSGPEGRECQPRAVPSWSPFSAEYKYMGRLEIWVSTSRQFSSILSAAEILRRGDIPDRDTLRKCWPGVVGFAPYQLPDWRRSWRYLIGVVESLKAEAKIKATIVAPRREGISPALVFVREEGLYPALVSELGTALGQGEFATCCACGRVFVPTRRLRQDRRIYCADCRSRKVPFRDAQRDYRARQMRRRDTHEHETPE